MEPAPSQAHDELDQEDRPSSSSLLPREETGLTVTIREPQRTSEDEDGDELKGTISQLERIPVDSAESSSACETDDEVARTDPKRRANRPAMVTGEVRTVVMPSNSSVINFRLNQIGIDMRKPFPDAPTFDGYEPGTLDLLLFVRHLRQKMLWDKEMYPTAQDQMAYALSRLEVEERAYFTEYLNEDGSIRLDSLEDFIEILCEKHNKSEKAVISLKSAIALLERKLKKKEPGSKRQEIRSGLHVDPWPAFKQLVEGRPPTTLQALSGKYKLYWQKSTDEMKPFRVDSEAGVPLEIWEEKWRNGREIPERVRINSPDLLQALKDVCEDEWAAPEVPNDELENQSVVFLRPYKFFWHYRENIDKKKERLEDKIHELESSHAVVETNESGVGGPEAAPQERETQQELRQTRKLLDDMKCLVRFIETAVTPVARRYRDYEGMPQKITFGDLWYLFRPGEVAVSRGSNEDDAHTSSREDDRSASQNTSSEPIAWKIFDVADGRPRLCPGHPKDEYAKTGQSFTFFRIQCYKIDYDGSTMGPTTAYFSIAHFEGERDIHSLPLVPLRCARNQEKLQQRFESIGRKFLSVTKPAFCHQLYTGKTYTHLSTGAESRPAAQGLGLTSKHIQGSVIVDFATAFKEDPEWTSVLTTHPSMASSSIQFIEAWPFKVWKGRKEENEASMRPGEENEESQPYHSISVDECIYNDSHVDRSIRLKLVSDDPFLSEFQMCNDDEHITVEDFEKKFFMDNKMILADKVCAYILDRMCFALLAVEGLRDPIQDSQGWNDLILESAHQTVIKALVRNHRMKHKQGVAQMNRPTHDLVAGKGEGLIILLHGAPGLGKTSTVECLRDELQVPLLSLSCGNLGNHAKEIEDKLEMLFYRAQIWNCLILLDEADVVLVERGRDQFRENEVCSVFLRKLEYYQGVLFLTTNRVGHIDEAIKSRIHLAIHYPNLSEDVMEDLFRNTLQRLKSSPEYGSRLELNPRVMARQCMQFISEKMELESVNGRVIRNISQVAVALAEEEAPTESSSRRLQIQWKHFEQALEFHANFESYLRKTRGSDSKRATELTLRNDEWRKKEK